MSNFFDDIDGDGFEGLLSALFGGPIEFKSAGPGKPVHAPTRAYRIEMPNGNGPYNSGLPNATEIYDVICQETRGYNCAHLAFANQEHMGITDAAFSEAHGHASYACTSIDALHRWFPLKARQYLAQFGAKVVVYELPVGAHLAHVGHGEVLIAKHECRKVEVLDVVTTLPPLNQLAEPNRG